MSVETNGHRREHPPSADLYVTNDAVIVEVELPGFSADEIVVGTSHRVVTVSGRRENDRGDRRYLLRERAPAAFRREFRLPVGCDCGVLSWNFADGVLAIRVPRAAWPHPQPVRLAPACYRAHLDYAVD